MKLSDLTQDERIALGVAAAQAIKFNLPADGFGQTKRLNDYADLWGATARTAVLNELAKIIADRNGGAA